MWMEKSVCFFYIFLFSLLADKKTTYLWPAFGAAPSSPNLLRLILRQIQVWRLHQKNDDFKVNR